MLCFAWWKKNKQFSIIKIKNVSKSSKFILVLVYYKWNKTPCNFFNNNSIQLFDSKWKHVKVLYMFYKQRFPQKFSKRIFKLTNNITNLKFLCRSPSRVVNIAHNRPSLVVSDLEQCRRAITHQTQQQEQH